MEVPVRRTPGNQVSTRQLGFQQAAGYDLSPVSQGLSQLKQAFDQEVQLQREDQLKRQKFELNKRLLEERERMQRDFQARQTDPGRSINTFADDIDTDYEAAHKAVLDEFWEKGYDQDLLESYASQLGGLRDGFFGAGLAHQAQALGVRAKADVDKIATLASQAVASNPDSFVPMLEYGLETIRNNPDLTDAERQVAEQNLERTLRGTGAKAFAISRPDETLELLDPQGLFRTRPAPGVTGTAGRVVAKPGTFQSVATTVANELGLSAEQVAAVMSFETAGTLDPNISGGDGGRYLGLIQLGPEEQQKYGIRKGSTPDEWSGAILGFMRDRGFRPGMGIEDFYSTILTGKPGRYNATDSNGTSVRNALPRILSEHGMRARAWLAEAIETVDPGQSTAGQVPAVQVPVEEAAPIDFSPLMAQTGNPLLDALTGEERLQMIGWASEQIARQTASQKAAMDVLLQNIRSEALANGEVASPLPSEEEVLSTYGPVEGPQRWAQMQQTLNVGKSIQAFRTLSPESIQTQLDKLRPVPGSPTFAVDQQIYDAAESAAAQLFSEREADPAAYAMKHFPSVIEAAEKGEAAYYAELDRVFAQLGIDPDAVSPLPKASEDALAEKFRYMQPAERVQWMQDNFRTMGEDRFQRFVDNLEGTTAATDARIYAALRTVAPAAVIRQVLEGQEIIRKDPARKPNFQALKTQFREDALQSIRNLDPRYSGAVQEAASAYYAFKGGDPVNIDVDLYRESLKVALGGREIADFTKNVFWGPDSWRIEPVRDTTILPPGVTKQKFENWLESRRAGDLTQLSVDKRPPVYSDLKTPVELNDIIDYGVFVMTSPDVYIIKDARTGKPLATSAGRPFRVRLGRGAIK